MKRVRIRTPGPRGLERWVSLTSAITREGTFWLYAGFGVAALIYFAVRVPETKDRSLEQIERELGTSGGPTAASKQQAA